MCWQAGLVEKQCRVKVDLDQAIVQSEVELGDMDKLIIDIFFITIYYVIMSIIND